MDRLLTLDPTEFIRERPFTNPKRIKYDVNTLRFMVDQLHLYLSANNHHATHQKPVIVHQPDRERWFYRLVIAQPEILSQSNELAFVGFLGHKREDANQVLGDAFDEVLIDEIPDHPGLLCYSTMAMLSGDFTNLVIFTDTKVKKQWSQSTVHAQAVRRLSPDYYVSIKLYNGKLPDGIIKSSALQLTRVKYYDYRVNPPWHAVRELPEDHNF